MHTLLKLVKQYGVPLVVAEHNQTKASSFQYIVIDAGTPTPTIRERGASQMTPWEACRANEKRWIAIVD